VTGLLWTIVLLPFLGALILIVFGGLMPKKLAGAIGCASVGVSAVLALVTTALFLKSDLNHVNAALYPWFSVGGLKVSMTLHLDSLSLVWMAIVTFVGFLIHLYASQSMYNEDGYSRFFGYMNLFVGSMLVLVLAGDLLVLYLGWEGVGLCSYLLIGFWYKDRANVRAANKAFIVTRIGDTAMAVGLFLLFREFGTLNIEQISLVSCRYGGEHALLLIAFLLLAGAVGKSAQIPLQVWLPDAMAGPTPVSALIHAATMVTAGVYLIARMSSVFKSAPAALLAVALIGTVTLLYAGFSALVQRDIKRVLAYSTISQIGYMFLALGVGAWGAAVFHFLTHAFFKSLLFLSAGIVIDAQGHEHDVYKMGGLKTSLPVAFWTFLIGAASLSALPFVTAGFYSKDAIILASWASNLGSIWFVIAGLAGTMITGAYAFRVVFLVFFGEQKIEVTHQPGSLMKLAVIVLAFFALTAGVLKGPVDRMLEWVVPPLPIARHTGESTLIAVSIIESILAIYLAYLYFKRWNWTEAAARSRAWQSIHRFLFVGWGFDWLYDRVFVRPFKAIAYGNRDDFIDKLYAGLAEAARYANIGLSRTQTGRLRNYAAGLVLGAIILAAVVWLR
jgi:NADH-quinone oxidoreductase subunit L